jgi:hypothetical protein
MLKVFFSRSVSFTSMVIHRYGKCRQKTMGIDCQFGLRQRSYNVLSGSVLSVWTKVESVLSSNFGGKMQVFSLLVFYQILNTKLNLFCRLYDCEVVASELSVLLSRAAVCRRLLNYLQKNPKMSARKCSNVCIVSPLFVAEFCLVRANPFHLDQSLCTSANNSFYVPAELKLSSHHSSLVLLEILRVAHCSNRFRFFFIFIYQSLGCCSTFAVRTNICVWKFCQVRLVYDTNSAASRFSLQIEIPNLCDSF